ncbi:MAG: translation initiation factor IF-3 [Chloroflexi bacterium]|nr:translation initiation factor IF-3 [Chloroflexota bacterium]
MFKELRVNNRIFAKEVRLVGDKGEQLGVMPTVQALEMARKQSLDLVEVAPTATPPVCRILDYGKYKYEQTKKEQKSRKSQKLLLLRQIRLRPKIGNHDFEAKARTAKKLLAGGDKVKVAIIFRGREITHPDIGWKLLKRMAEFLSDVGAADGQPGFDGKQMSIILMPAARTRAKEVKEEKKETVNAKAQNP